MTGICVKYSAACLSIYTIHHSQEMHHVQNLKGPDHPLFYSPSGYSCFYAALYKYPTNLVRCVAIIPLNVKIILPEHDTV